MCLLLNSPNLPVFCPTVDKVVPMKTGSKNDLESLGHCFCPSSFSKDIFKCFEQHKQKFFSPHCIGVKAETAKMDFPWTQQIKDSFLALMHGCELHYESTKVNCRKLSETKFKRVTNQMTKWNSIYHFHRR